MNAYEAVQARQAKERASAVRQSTRRLIVAIVLASLLVGVATVLLLIRNVVPRVRAYSHFAQDIAAGELSGRLEVKGADELAQLGRALNHMVERQQGQRDWQDAQGEFADMTQVTEAEEEAHELLKRHLERSIPECDVVVFSRNNSENRLEAKTALPADSPLGPALPGAQPRSCLAVRFGRTHSQGDGREPLVSCELCETTPDRSTCEPLLVSGEIIGSVLVNHRGSLGENDRQAISTSVTQAAPVLGNLRNLAIAELRAATDALTGLPNDRAVKDTLKRMVAQASRTVAPLSAVMLDLDHFKQVNDVYGHSRATRSLPPWEPCFRPPCGEATS